MSVARAEQRVARLLFVELLAALRDDADRGEEAAEGETDARPAAAREPVAAA